ncbi:UDP-N-acetylmuramoyl-tripeptide--D-alanyl-D-alanine ligase [Streptococcus moroccensis]|uniref:UDP-N-acetylmuramoyl-tripeptide--D-alanyl-D-alanine ligase n=1 Tax=Streptococcus moroccensis TaxID=1451356 RepID=A0ABT9YTC1_9STRE|nr:UDP-N-acetylmuramoyl-tripeptide--D-alanyl-D-alanine ligase [Streptococcus moroccensis]MDQ0223239.1 UDP-N-acetylmuramoyl-tripeptide--D-alanyl-D-alanine ligase [Streptococcus moroccensis]
MRLSLHEIAQVVSAQNDYSQYPDHVVSGIEFDSRKITSGDIFLPLKGARDGHAFIPVAFDNGAQATLSEVVVEGPHLLVEDCLTAFQQLASYYVQKIGVDVIAVTGSNGKTTTKDMIHDILATTFKTYKTQGNYNNEIGLPYTVLHMPDDTEKLVLEMGQDHLGDINLLSKIARPQISVVTLVGEAHLEFFGKREKIAEGKLQIADGMPKDGLLLVPNDPILKPYLPDDQEIVFFGEGAALDVTDLVEEKSRLTFQVPFIEGEVKLPVPGRYNATNAMLAAYVAKACGVTDENIKAALATLNLTRNRTEWKVAENGAEILSDVYNANPTAMRLILETFAAIAKNPGGRKLVVLADMKELGDASASLHANMRDSISDKIDKVYLYGPEMKPLAEAMASDERVLYYPDYRDFERLKADLKADLQPADQILLKGSNSMRLGQVVDLLVGE